jgi:hypothetical protein
MNLDVFIKEALISIVTGIEESQKMAESKGAFINPLGVEYRNNKDEGLSNEGHRTSTIEFDLSVTVQETSTTQGGVGVKTGIINIGVGGDSTNSNNFVNRIKFSVPVLFPFQKFNPSK